MTAAPEAFWQQIHPSGTFAPRDAFADAYPATLDDGRGLLLPIRALPGGEHAVASLIITQAAFDVVDALAADLARKLRPRAPDLVVGLPTLGLTLAAAVARHLGHDRYVALGTSRKFWYDDARSVELSSITSPGVPKRLYIDPRMVPLLDGRRVALVDDVISSGVSLAAGIGLLARCACTPVVYGAAMLQSERWRGPLAAVPGNDIIACLATPILARTPDGTWKAST
jgi:adenine/guanine phosphoribosyltransferase-like PRPP-binding protein